MLQAITNSNALEAAGTMLRLIQKVETPPKTHSFTFFEMNDKDCEKDGSARIVELIKNVKKYRNFSTVLLEERIVLTEEQREKKIYHYIKGEERRAMEQYQALVESVDSLNERGLRDITNIYSKYKKLEDLDVNYAYEVISFKSELSTLGLRCVATLNDNVVIKVLLPEEYSDIPTDDNVDGVYIKYFGMNTPPKNKYNIRFYAVEFIR